MRPRVLAQLVQPSGALQLAVTVAGAAVPGSPVAISVAPSAPCPAASIPSTLKQPFQACEPLTSPKDVAFEVRVPMRDCWGNRARLSTSQARPCAGPHVCCACEVLDAAQHVCVDVFAFDRECSAAPLRADPPRRRRRRPCSFAVCDARACVCGKVEFPSAPKCNVSVEPLRVPRYWLLRTS